MGLYDTLTRTLAVAWLAVAAHGCIDSELVGRVCQVDCGPAVVDAGRAACDADSCAPACDGGSCTPACDADSCESAADASDGSACEPRFYALTRKRLDVYMLIDDSASLLLSWQAILDGLAEFFAEESSRGIGVGLQLFGTACEPDVYAMPLVPIAPLPGNAAALQRALPALPAQSTSTLPALQGALTHARSWAGTHVDADVVVLLVTDAIPAECDPSGDYIAQLTQVAQDALHGQPSIRTFVVGFGALDAAAQLAFAGGTDPVMSATTAMKEQVVDALHSLRDSALPCSFSWPDAVALAAGSSSSVRYVTPQAGELRLTQRSTREECGEQDGFYLDGPPASYRLNVCPRSCERLPPSAQLELQTACEK